MKKSIRRTFSISRIIPKTGKPSALPGTVKYVGKEQEGSVKLHIMDYNETDFTEKDISSIAECLQYKDKPTVIWLNVTGVHDEHVIHDIGEIFNIHPLVLEDIANTTQRPKVEEHDDYLFAVIKMGYFSTLKNEILLEQVSLLVGKNFVISLQEKEGDILEAVRERIRFSRGKIRKMGSDYLMYSIIDTVVDHYFSVLEYVGEQIEELETELMQTASQDLLTRIYTLKQELVFIRKSIWPMSDVVSSIERTETNLLIQIHLYT